MTMTEERRECSVARDLFIAYLAGEVSPATGDWLAHHLEECEACRGALATMADGILPSEAAPATAEAQAEMATDKAWRQLLRRVQRRNRVVTVILALALIITCATFSWCVKSISAWGGLPLYQPVPPVGTAPAEAVSVDLTPFGLTPGGVSTTGDTGVAAWSDSAGATVTVTASRFPSSATAQEAFLEWYRTESPIFVGLRQWEPTSRGTAMFRNSRTCFYGWQTGEWFITIRVPTSVPNAPRLCATIRDALFAAYAAGSSVPSGVPTPKPWR